MKDNVYNIDERRRPANDRPLGDTVAQAATDLCDFVETRLAMLRSEMREKLANLKFAAPLVVAATLFGFTAWLLLTGAVVAVIAAAFGSTPYAAFMALVIVGAVYTGIAVLAYWMAKGRLGRAGLMPERTINVLKEDKVWLQQEAKTQL